MDPLVDVNWLGANMADVRLIDLRWYLKLSPNGKTAKEEYGEAHLPGAWFVDLEKEITAASGPGRHPIPSRQQMEAMLFRLDVNRNTKIVVYDDAGGSIAARLYWLLRHYGHENVAVLDGGYGAWLGSGRPVTRVAPSPSTSSQPVTHLRDGQFAVVDKVGVQKAREAGALILDARAKERYLGQTEPVDARAGHIPGAKNLPWSLQTKDGRFRPASELRALYTQLGEAAGREVVVYCGSGVTACHLFLGREVAGLPQATLYEGSWSDWARDASLPLATTDEDLSE